MLSLSLLEAQYHDSRTSLAPHHVRQGEKRAGSSEKGDYGLKKN